MYFVCLICLLKSLIYQAIKSHSPAVNNNASSCIVSNKLWRKSKICLFHFAFSIEFSTFRFKMKSFFVLLTIVAYAVAVQPTWNGILDKNGNYIPGDMNL